VTGGPGSFLIHIDNFESFAEAITRKLISEIAGVPSEPRSALLQ